MPLLGSYSGHHLRLSQGLLLWLVSTMFSTPVSARLVNITVDDTFGDPTTGLFPEYSPNNGTWNAGSSSENCPSCYIGPSILDLAQIHNGTWHDTTYLPWETPATITVRFNGSAVYVFNILPNTLPSTITIANISFSIDGEDVYQFLHSPESGTTILYNQLVYRNTTLSDGTHILTMTAGSNSLVLFDYLLYTTQGNNTMSTETTSRQPSSSSVPAGAIVGAVVGGVVLLGAVVAAFFLRRKHARSRDMLTAVHAYMEDDGGGGSERKYPIGEDPAYSPPLPTPMSPTSPTEPALRSFDIPMAHYPSYLLPGDISAPHTRSSLVVPEASSPSTMNWSLRRRAELAQRLESLQRTRSVLSSHAPSSPSRTDISSTGEARTEAAIRELEAEMSQLRGVLTTLNARLADGHGRYLEPLPEYVE